MLRNFIVIACRNLLHHKVFSCINMLGLAIGIAASLLLLQYVAYERSYDAFHTNADNIYRIQHDTYKSGVLESRSAITYYGAAPAIKENFREVTKYVRLHRADGMFNHYNNSGELISHYEKKAFYADSTFFDIFSFPLITGDKNKILRRPSSLIISESAAKKYFGNDNPVGKTISIATAWQGGDYHVEGVFSDLPDNSHLSFDFIFSIDNLLRNEQFKHGAWYWTNFYTYLLLKPETDPIAFEQNLYTVIDTHLGRDLRKINREEKFILQPLKDIHLYSNIGAEITVNGDYRLVSFLLVISFFITGIAWLNYINLSTAKATERAREVGMRKVFGSNKPQLIKQFLIEALLLTTLSAIIAAGLFAIATPYFMQLAGKEILPSFVSQTGFWVLALGILMLGSFLSGLYPAFVLASFHPLIVIKGKFIRNKSSATLRRTMVVFQFSAAILLIVATMTVYKQLEFMRNSDLGLAIAQKVILRAPRLIKKESYLNVMDNFKHTMLRHPDVTSVSTSSEVPGQEIFWTNEFRMDTDSDNVRRIASILAVDEDFIPAYEIKILAGRNFMKERASDYGGAVLINQSALSALGFKNAEMVINKELVLGNQFRTIIGVVEDFHQQSLKNVKLPTIIQYIPWNMDYLTLSFSSSNVKGTMSAIEKVYRDIFPENAFEYFFLDDQFNQQYQTEERTWKIFILFSGLAILVACMGLFGLSSFMVIQRTKEVAIRKILGATVTNITLLLSKDLIVLVFLSFTIVTPIAAHIMNEWLLSFAYRIDIPWWAFILSGTLTAIIALLTVSFQAVRAALTNPVKSVKVD